uniref:Uncharacterized protein LOC104229785 n=1 Tax=Nicotiana sylvestris TaxID=4096 RepID=A0A1U7X1N5_NICSY
MENVCEQFKITHRNSTPYQPKANVAVEAANKNIKKILRKTIQMRTSVGATPYLLVYGTKAMIPAGVEIPSLRTIVEAEIEDDEKILPRGALYLGDIEGNDPETAVNTDAVK